MEEEFSLDQRLQLERMMKMRMWVMKLEEVMVKVMEEVMVP